MSAKKPYTLRQRRSRAFVQQGFGFRPTNAWGEGDLPAPWAEGDLVELVEHNERTDDWPLGFYVVSTAFSVDEGDGWYFRITDGRHDSGRLHVAYVERCESNWNSDSDIDWMSGLRLVETADPEGLALRERMLAEGWGPKLRPTCPTCGSYTGPRQ